MKNYFKKFSIMFVMSLILMLGSVTTAFAAPTDGFEIGTTNLNNTDENSAKIGDQLTEPEKGWKRYDDTNSKITYSLISLYTTKTQGHYNLSMQRIPVGNTIKFNFTGDKLIIITLARPDSKGFEVYIDNKDVGKITDNFSSTPGRFQNVSFVKTDLDYKEHYVCIKGVEDSGGIYFDAIDIDRNGELKSYNENISSISLNKSTDNLQVGQTDNLVATTTPAGAQVIWKSSDESIATVDSTGKVTAVEEGTCIITATINDGSNLSDFCTINVTKKDTTEPNEPDNSKAILIINLTDGETKVFDVSYSEVSKFKQWYNTKSEFENKLTYEFNKTANSSISVEEDVVHDQITSYEIRKY